jgi:hypothetical protein
LGASWPFRGRDTQIASRPGPSARQGIAEWTAPGLASGTGPSRAGDARARDPPGRHLPAGIVSRAGIVTVTGRCGGGRSRAHDRSGDHLLAPPLPGRDHQPRRLALPCVRPRPAGCGAAGLHRWAARRQGRRRCGAARPARARRGCRVAGRWPRTAPPRRARAAGPLTRLFRAETGLSSGAWRRRPRPWSAPRSALPGEGRRRGPPRASAAASAPSAPWRGASRAPRSGRRRPDRHAADAEQTHARDPQQTCGPDFRAAPASALDIAGRVASCGARPLRWPVCGSSGCTAAAVRVRAPKRGSGPPGRIGGAGRGRSRRGCPATVRHRHPSSR